MGTSKTEVFRGFHILYMVKISLIWAEKFP